MANYPTPQNIRTITYQLLQQVGDPSSIRGQLPILSIQFVDDNSVVRNKMVSFREMLPYLRYLHDKAVSLGKFLVCDPESTFDKKIVFTIGDVAPVDRNKPINFKLDGVNFALINNLTNVANTTIVDDANVIGQFDVAMVLFNLPIKTLVGGVPQKNPLEEYNFPPELTCINWEVDVDLWAIRAAVRVLNDGAVSYNITSNEFLKITTNNTLTENIFIYSNEGSEETQTINNTTQYIRKTNGISVNYGAGVRGGITITQKQNGVSLSSDYCRPYLEAININPLADEINILPQLVTIRKAPGMILALPTISVSLGNNFEEFDFINDAAPNRTQNVKGEGDIMYIGDSSGSGDTWFMTLLKQGIIIHTEPIVFDGQPGVVAMSNPIKDYDEVQINGVAAGTGFPIDLQAANGSPCGAGAVTYYIDHAGSIAPGDIVYTDVGLTTPLAGNTQIVDPTNQVIYAIDIVTGVVGAATGNFCGDAVPNMTVNNAADTVPPDNIICNDVRVNALSIVGGVFPVAPGAGTNGTFPFNDTLTIEVDVVGANGTTIRVVDSVGAFHDQAYHGADTYTFVGISCAIGATPSVILL